MSRSVEYCKSYLAALVAVMARGDTASSQRVVLLAPLEEPVLLECLDLLLRDLEDQRGGPEFLSQAFSAASLLLSHWPQSRFLHILLPHFISLLSPILEYVSLQP